MSFTYQYKKIKKEFCVVICEKKALESGPENRTRFHLFSYNKIGFFSVFEMTRKHVSLL